MATMTKAVIFCLFFLLLQDHPEGQTQQFSTAEISLPPKSPSVRETFWALLYYFTFFWGWSVPFTPQGPHAEQAPQTLGRAGLRSPALTLI